ncbi:hypothetical protein [Litchfieldella xinjiangensis]|uniref:hypothetical protein n=1 Tax=Litchfieldella xinjiangensis TaxID=1166948 RepID=UPI0005B7A690|nr:hypothetical protein [Halomonas xinjiangensis]
MIWHLIAALFAGLGAAGIGLLLRSLSGNRLPRWVIPVCGGLGMLVYQIHHEYSWFRYKQEQLPESAQVVSTERDSMLWRPWTYLYPMTVGFSVIDSDNTLVRESDDETLVEFLLYRFRKEYVDVVDHQAYLLNCNARELLPLAGESRRPQVDQLRRLEPSAPLVQAVCPAD